MAKVGTSEGPSAAKSLDQLNAVHFDALVALARRVTDALLRLEDLHAGTPQRAGMQVDVATAIVRHDETEAFLIVKEFDFAFDHRAAGSGIAVAMATAAEAIIAAEPISAPKAVASAETIMAAAKAVSTTKAITPASTAAEPVTAAIAEIAARFAGSRCVRRAGIDAVHRHDLKTSG